MKGSEISEFFDQIYSGAEPFFGAAVRPEFAAWCDRNSVTDKRALDVGCGDGRYCLFLAERGASVIGADISEAGLAKLRNQAASRSLDVQTVRMDLCSDPLPAGPFDLVTIDTVLGHLDIDCARRVIAAIFNALQPDGIVYVSAFTTRDPGYDPGDERASELKSSASHYFAPEELRRLFNAFAEISYKEFSELSTAHGPAHWHAYAVGFFRKA